MSNLTKTDTNQTVYPARITEAGAVLVGGCKIGEVARLPDGSPALVIKDRYRNRCRLRGTDQIAIDLTALTSAAQRAVNGT